jgi:TRAP-type C4-dicarboxylate transport system substrate-binding protein
MPPAAGPVRIFGDDFMTLRAVLTGFICMAALLPAQAADRRVDLKLSHWFAAGHPAQKAMQQWADAVAQASQGTLRVTLEARGELGRGQDHLGIVRRGSADLVLVEPVNDPSRFPVAALAALPFTAARADGAAAAIDAWYRPFAARELASVKFCFALVGAPGTLHMRGKPVMRPQDMRGLLIAADNPVLNSYVTALGATSALLPDSLLRAGLEGNAIDGVLRTWDAVATAGVEKAAGFHLDTPFYVTPLALVMSKASYSTLSPAQKRVVDDHCNTDWAAKAVSEWNARDTAARAAMARSPDQSLTAVPPDALAAWRQSVAPLRDEAMRRTTEAGFDAGAVGKALEASLARYKAGY